MGSTPSASARTVIGVPCTSLPDTINTLLPITLWYLAKISAGRYAPPICPKCLEPLAYGQATETKMFFDIHKE